MKKACIFCLLLLFGSTYINAQENEKNTDNDSEKEGDPVEVLNPEYTLSTIKIKDSIYMLQGKGGNVGVYIGKEGALIIDSQFEESAPKILDIVARLTNKKVQLLINTHHHGDHTGGNEIMHNNDILTIAHKNVRNIMVGNEVKKIEKEIEDAYKKTVDDALKRGATAEESEAKGKNAVRDVENNNPIVIPTLPKIVFENELELFFDQQQVKVFHLNNAHTRGDAVVFFMDDNVIHTGDTFVKGKYPFIDTENGGTYQGYLKGLQKLLLMVNEDTVIIPGHGGLSRKADIKYLESMMRYIIPKIQYHVVTGKSLQEVLAMKETKKWDDEGFGTGFITTEKFVSGIYNSFKKPSNKNK